MKHRKTRRTALVKSHVTDDEKDAFRRACTAIGKSCSDVLRDFCLTKIQGNGTPQAVREARPKLVDIRTQHFPSRRPHYGVATHLMRYRV